MRVVLSVVFSLWSAIVLASGACSLKIGPSPKLLYRFGAIPVAEVAPTYIWWARGAGDLMPSDPQGHSQRTFNYNTLYRLTNNTGESWYFRFWGEWFDSAKTHRTAFYGVQWANGKYPLIPGEYKVSSVYDPRPQIGRKTFSTIGDSMTWFNNGQAFRCDLASKLPNYRFVGSNTDSFGFGHDGHGGDNTYQTLQRIGEVPTSDAYFLLIGSNDGGMSPRRTAENIANIIKHLLHRGNRPHVYVSTLPVRGDKLAYLVHKRNAAIKTWYASCGCRANVVLIDTHAAMQRKPDALARYINPAPDLIHPTLAGYDLLSDLIAHAVTDEDNARIAKGIRHAADSIPISATADSRPMVTR